MGWEIFLSMVGVGAAIVGSIYAFLRNFKSDIKSEMDRMERHMNQLDARMFWLATGKHLEDVLLEERKKQ